MNELRKTDAKFAADYQSWQEERAKKVMRARKEAQHKPISERRKRVIRAEPIYEI